MSSQGRSTTGDEKDGEDGDDDTKKDNIEEGDNDAKSIPKDETEAEVTVEVAAEAEAELDGACSDSEYSEEDNKNKRNGTSSKPPLTEMDDLSFRNKEQSSQFNFGLEDQNGYNRERTETGRSFTFGGENTPRNQNDLMRLLVNGDTQRFDQGLDEYHDNELNEALKRRLRDFRFAQNKRREKYGQQHPWGIIGLYDHLTGIRTDVEWAEDAAWRRENGEPYLAWGDFEDAKDTGLNRPFCTYSIMIICTICLLVSIGINDWKVEAFSVNPMIGPSADTLVDMGAKQTSLIVNDYEWYRIITPMVMHAGIIHFFINMLALWFVGCAVESSHGFVAAMLLFVLPAIGGTIISALFLPEYISVGASGGIFGLIGACLADIFSNWNLLFSKEVNNSDEGTRFRHIKVLLWLFLDILLNILIGLTPFVDNFTHMGGMIYGFLCGLSFMERLSKAFFGMKTECFSKFQVMFVKFFGVILSVILIIISIIILANSDGTRTTCRGCRFVSCVPFPFWESYENKWWYCDDCDMVKAQGDSDGETNYFTSMNLTCPDGAVEFIDLSGEQFTSIDVDWLGKQLPTYCRQHCDELYAN